VHRIASWPTSHFLNAAVGTCSSPPGVVDFAVPLCWHRDSDPIVALADRAGQLSERH
jgi:hypothetical protein